MTAASHATRALPLCDEFIIDSARPIIDAHHHLWLLPESNLAAMESRPGILARSLAATFRRHSRYLLDEFLLDIHSGHNVCATVFIDAHTMYRSRGPESMKSVGEVEFINGIAAAADSGVFSDAKVCAGIVGGVDLRMADEVRPVLEAHIRAGGDRYRGVRSHVVYDEDVSILGPRMSAPKLLLDSTFRAGFKWLQHFGLSFEAWILEPQLPELLDLARAFPETAIILNHTGAPVGVGRYQGQREARYPLWLESMQALAKQPNVHVKLGGLGLPFTGFRTFGATPPASSEQLAAEWRPYVEPCIEAFGAHRCMFESNFPVDSVTCSYTVLWNAFKRLAEGASEEEKTALFSGTAKRVYRLDI